MDVVTGKKKIIKKLRPLTSFLIIAFSIILLVYATIYDISIITLVVFLVVIKIIDITFVIYRVRRRKHQYQF